MSDLFTVNHNEAGGTFEPLPIQEYECVISEVKIGKSKGEKTNGCDQLELTLTVREDIEQPGKRRKFFDTIIFAPTLAWKVQQFYRACAFPDGTRFANIEEVAKNVAYRCIRIKNRHETYEGKVRDRVDAYLPSQHPLEGGYAPAPSDPFKVDSTATPPNPFGDNSVPF